MSIKKEGTKKGGNAITTKELVTEEPLSEKDEQSKAIERTAEIQTEIAKKKRKRIIRIDKP